MKRLFSLSIWVFALLYGYSQSYVPEKKDKKVVIGPKIPIEAYAFSIEKVHLLESPFKKAMALDSAYLLSIQPDRLLHRFHVHAGLTPKDSVYGGWESMGLSGHTMGHYLSACAMMYASTGNLAFKERVDYIVAELARCQAARGTGNIGAIPKEDEIFGKVAKGEIKSSGFDLNGGWSPWYTVHKVMSGLADAYLYCKNNQALQSVKAMSDWVYNTVHHLDDSTRLLMLNCEYGGMNEVLANVYAMTGDKKYLDLSYKFYDEFVMGKLAQKIDPLPGKHSNTNVPKAIGSARQYELTGNTRDQVIASFFWESMVHHHSYVIGGNSNYEYCGKPDSLNNRLSDATCETCNTYNMLKLTRHLFAWKPSANLMDYYERALYNHILASQHPENGMMTYFVPLRMGSKKTFSDPFNTFTCCVGSGIENHSKYAEQIYSHGENGLFLNLFIPSELIWEEKGIHLRQETQFPENNRTTLTFLKVPKRSFVLYIRKPFWVQGEMKFDITPLQGGEFTDLSGDPKVDIYEGYIPFRIKPGNNTKLEISWKMDLYTESMPDNPKRIAIKYGPLVMAGVLGTERPDPLYGVPVLLSADKDLHQWLRPVAGAPLNFEMLSAGKPKDVSLMPFYKIYDQHYSVYWDYFTESEWEGRKAEYEAEKKRQADIAARTIDDFRVGEMQPERDHKLLASERSYVSEAMGRKGREARSGNYFSFEMAVQSGANIQLLLTYVGDDKDRIFDILIDDTPLTKVQWKGGVTGKFYDVVYDLPAALVAGKEKIKVTIQANDGKTAGRVFSAKTLLHE